MGNLTTVMQCDSSETNLETKHVSWYETIEVGGAKIKMKVDTGAETNTIPEKTWKRIPRRPDLKESTTMLKALNGTELEHAGSAITSMKVNQVEPKAEIFVTKGKACPILGLETAFKLGLIQKGENATCKIEAVSTRKKITEKTMKEDYPEVFTGLGKFPGQYKMQLSEDAVPMIQPPRRISHHLYESLKKKLQEMEDEGIVERVDKPTEWVHNLVITEKKDGSLRVCLDPRELNKYIKREHHQIPTFDETITRIHSPQFITTMDLKAAFWQIELDEETADICTFHTPVGRFRFLRLPFGVSSASEVLQKKAYQIFGSIENVHTIADDILIRGRTEKQHDEALRAELDKGRSHNIKFNPAKIQFLYHGVRLTEAGIKPDKSKIQAIEAMPDPEDKAAVQRFLGMVNYLSPYIPNKSDLTRPLRNMLKSEARWEWSHEQKAAVENIKKELSKEPLLRYYDSKKPVTIQADASSTGLGACLMQEGQPISYAARVLTETEQQYAPIEKELLAIVFAAEKFNHHIYGAETEVESDHRPLEAIFKKSLHKTLPRLQQMLLRLLKYKLTVKYIPGSRMYIAYTLSRAYITEENRGNSPVNDVRIHSVIADFPASKERLYKIRVDTQEEEDLQKIKQYVRKGLPKRKQDLKPAIQPY